MQTILSEMFDNMLNTTIQPLKFSEKGYFGKCDDCLKIKALIKVNNEKLLCKSCDDISDELNNKQQTIDIDFKEELVYKALEMQLKKISNKQQTIDEILKLSDKLKILIRLNNKIIQKLQNQLDKLYSTKEDDKPNN